MDEGGNRRRAFHGIRQPDVKRNLRRFAAGADEKQQRRGGQNGVADREMSATQEVFTSVKRRGGDTTKR